MTTTLTSTNPATGETIWQGPAADAATVDRAVMAARKAFPAWANRPLEERITIVERYGELVKENGERIAEAISKETGKVLWDARTEAAAMAGKIAISIKAYHDRTGEKVLEPMAGATPHLRHRPHGVMAVFGPYNFPAHLPNGHIVPAIIAGNTAVMKPSQLTPGVAELMHALWQQAGLPNGVFSVVQGLRETGMALAAHHEIDGLLFTGSTGVGSSLHAQYGGQPWKILALEMGGNNPLIVWDAAEAETVAFHLVQSSFISTGQRCTCARRLILPQGKEGDAVLDALIALTRTIRVGAYDESPEPYFGPLIRNAEAEAMLKAQSRLASGGGTILLEGKRLDPERPFVTPGIVDVTHATTRNDEEVFAPFLQVIRVPDFDAALAEANNTAYGLASAIFTRDESLYRRCLLELRAGLINWNRQTTGASSALPFGGVGESGNHRPAAYYAADYCAYPVASLESTTLELPAQMPAGLGA